MVCNHTSDKQNQPRDQLIKTMAKFEKETKHRLYNFIKKEIDTRQNARQQQARMTQNVHFYRQDVHTVLLVIKSGR